MSEQTKTPADDANLKVVRVESRNRYELRNGDEVIGHAELSSMSGHAYATHTEINPAWGGRGLGGKLVAGMVDDLVAHDQTLTGVCPFVVKWLERNPAQASAVAPEGR